MSEGYDFILSKMYKPSDIVLPSDNWRETPNVELEELTVSIASIGLLQPPLVAVSKTGSPVAIFGNRRVMACKMLEAGYKTVIGGVPVTLSLPNSWQVAILKIPLEELTDTYKDRIRYHETERHLPFSNMAIMSRIRDRALSFCEDRALKFNSVRANKILNKELIETLAKDLAISKEDIVEILNLTKGHRPYKSEVATALYDKIIGRQLGQDLSIGIPRVKIEKLIQIIEPAKKRQVSEDEISKALSRSKRISKETKEDIISVFEMEVSKIEPVKTLTAQIPLSMYEAINSYRNRRNEHWNEFWYRTIKDNMELFTGKEETS